jgi:hypothetical protein
MMDTKWRCECYENDIIPVGKDPAPELRVVVHPGLLGNYIVNCDAKLVAAAKHLTLFSYPSSIEVNPVR